MHKDVEIRRNTKPLIFYQPIEILLFYLNHRIETTVYNYSIFTIITVIYTCFHFF